MPHFTTCGRCTTPDFCTDHRDCERRPLDQKNCRQCNSKLWVEGEDYSYPKFREFGLLPLCVRGALKMVAVCIPCFDERKA